MLTGISRRTAKKTESFSNSSRSESIHNSPKSCPTPEVSAAERDWGSGPGAGVEGKSLTSPGVPGELGGYSEVPSWEVDSTLRSGSAGGSCGDRQEPPDLSECQGQYSVFSGGWRRDDMPRHLQAACLYGDTQLEER